MSMPNPDVWGSWSNWIDPHCISVTGSGNWDIYACAPKVCQFENSSPSYTQCSLGRGVSVGKITANQAIDNSICICGQHPLISPFANIGIFKNFQNASDNKNPYKIWKEKQQINWFFGEVDTPNFTLRNHNINPQSSVQKWAPNADNTGSNNTNYYVSPYVYYQLKSIFLQILVDTIESYDQNGAPVVVTRYLNEWKNSHSTKKICAVSIRMCAYDSYSSNTIYYRTAPRGIANMCTTVCVMNPVDNIIDYATYTYDRRQEITLVSHLVRNYSDTDSIFYFTGYDLFESQIYKSVYYQNTDTGWNVWTEIPYSDNNYETILKMAALFGCPFTDTDKYSFNIDFLDNDIFLPVIPASGIAEGQYTRGADNASNRLYNMATVRNINYDPNVPITPYDPNNYNNVTGFNTLTTNANLMKHYVLDKANVEKLGDDLWTICETLSADDYENFDGKIKDEFLTTNPIDSIVSLIRFPFNIPHTFSNTKTPVQLGKSTGTAQGYLTYDMIFGVVFEGVDIWPRFGDCFLDYSPYTKYELYVPFCGTIEIEPGDILGHTLNLRLLVDFSTGAVLAFIMADQLVIGTAKGSCGVEQVLNGTQSATVNANIINGLITLDGIDAQRNAQIGKAIYPTGIIKDVLDPFGMQQQMQSLNTQMEQAEFNLTHIQTPVHKMGAPSPLLSWVQEFNARLMIYYPEGDVITSEQPPSLIDSAIAAFGHLKGFATDTPGTVTSFRTADRINYLRGNIFADSIPCTANERSRIRSLFSDGVYLPKIST